VPTKQLPALRGGAEALPRRLPTARFHHNEGTVERPIVGRWCRDRMQRMAPATLWSALPGSAARTMCSRAETYPALVQGCQMLEDHVRVRAPRQRKSHHSAGAYCIEDGKLRHAVAGLGASITLPARSPTPGPTSQADVTERGSCRAPSFAWRGLWPAGPWSTTRRLEPARAMRSPSRAGREPVGQRGRSARRPQPYRSSRPSGDYFDGPPISTCLSSPRPSDPRNGPSGNPSCFRRRTRDIKALLVFRLLLVVGCGSGLRVRVRGARG
jgi:hypothetical protein